MVEQSKSCRSQDALFPRGKHDVLNTNALQDVFASMYHFSNSGHGFQPISFVDLIKRLGLQMPPLDRETHEIWTVHRLAMILIDSLRHSFDRFIRSRPRRALVAAVFVDTANNGIRAAKCILHQSVLALDAVGSQACPKSPDFPRVCETPSPVVPHGVSAFAPHTTGPPHQKNQPPLNSKFLKDSVPCSMRPTRIP